MSFHGTIAVSMLPFEHCLRLLSFHCIYKTELKGVGEGRNLKYLLRIELREKNRIEYRKHAREDGICASLPSFKFEFLS